MTKPCYPRCSAWSQVVGINAEDPSDYAWNVNLGNGNANRNDQSNHNHVRAVRSGECHDQVSLRSLYSAWRAARRGKKPSIDQLMFEADVFGNLLAIQRALNGLHWYPSAPTCFIARSPKAREIHAPRFRDRVVHHLLVPHLERIFEPGFIHDSYSNRKGKGTHAAVDRLGRFVREVYSGQGGGYYLQLDIRNFFASIHRPTLWAFLQPRMERAALATPLLQAVHALLSWPIQRTGVIWACDESERSAVPPHKRLENSAPDCGIAIGNLSSQFFANVYLDALDQFVKHELKAERYVRYVDDFVLVHRDREQLNRWQIRIADFLRTHLRLDLKPDAKLRPLVEGIDFLGYVRFPTHQVVRRRVIGHCRSKLAAWERAHCRRGRVTRCRQAREKVRAIWASYVGHFAHASSFKTRLRIYRRFTWLSEVIAA